MEPPKWGFFCRMEKTLYIWLCELLRVHLKGEFAELSPCTLSGKSPAMQAEHLTNVVGWGWMGFLLYWNQSLMFSSSCKPSSKRYLMHIEGAFMILYPQDCVHLSSDAFRIWFLASHSHLLYPIQSWVLWCGRCQSLRWRVDANCLNEMCVWYYHVNK